MCASENGSLEELERLGFAFEDVLHHHPAFTGHLTLARFLAYYESYQDTLGLAGHIAEVGVGKASGLLFLAKLTQIFEPESLTLVHGFDRYRDNTLHARVRKLIDVQDLGRLVHLHRLDVTTDLDGFFAEHPHIQFKLVVLDVGNEDVGRACFTHLWPRIIGGGVLVLGRDRHEFIPDLPVHSYGFCAEPSGYLVKPENPDSA